MHLPAPQAALSSAVSPSRRGRVVVAAHRGASASAPENTRSAVRLGIAMDADLIEIDVRRTADGVLVVVHDATLLRTTDIVDVFPERAHDPVGAFTFADLRRLDAGAWRGLAGERIPTLAEVVEELTGSRCGLLLEMKDPELYPGIEQDVHDVAVCGLGGNRHAGRGLEAGVGADRLDRAPLNTGEQRLDRSSLDSGEERLHRGSLDARLIVQSFDWRSVQRFKALAPHVPVGLLGAPAVEQLPDLRWAELINPEWTDSTPELLDAIHANGQRALVWTVDDPSRVRELADAGADGIISNRPDSVRLGLSQARVG